MLAFFKTNKGKATPFSEFIRHASSAKKKRVYKDVLEKATNRQLKIIEEANTSK